MHSAGPRSKVCVQGLGFVGAAMATAVAQAMDNESQPMYDVVGIDLPNVQGLQRIEALNHGRFPFATTDAHLQTACHDAHRRGNLRASSDELEYQDCQIAIVDVHLDVDFGATPPRANLNGFTSAIRTLAKHLPNGSLIIVETTVPPGTTENLVVPIVQEECAKRDLASGSILVAHSYERVMPGGEYLSSIQNFWRVYAGTTEAAAAACEQFLSTVINTRDYPLTRLQRPIESECAKLMENSFRAVNIAFVDEWARFAEAVGIDLFAVGDAIRMRPTHRNLMRPGFGVGGYCLTKDPLLAGIGARAYFDLNAAFPLCDAAVAINEAMPHAVIDLLASTIGPLDGKQLLLLGASYRPDVADTRYSPSATFVKRALNESASVVVHDPMSDRFDDFDYPVTQVIPKVGHFDAIVFAVAHKEYLEPGILSWLLESTAAIVDGNGVLPHAWIEQLQNANRPVYSIGRG